MNLNDIKTIGVIGAGVMGPAIAEILAIFGASFDFAIFLCDISEEALKSAEIRMEADIAKVVGKENVSDPRTNLRDGGCAQLKGFGKARKPKKKNYA